MWTVRVLRAVHTDEEHPEEVHPGVKRKKAKPLIYKGFGVVGLSGPHSNFKTLSEIVNGIKSSSNYLYWLTKEDKVLHQRRAVHADRGIRARKHELPRGNNVNRFPSSGQ